MGIIPCVCLCSVSRQRCTLEPAASISPISRAQQLQTSLVLLQLSLPARLTLAFVCNPTSLSIKPCSLRTGRLRAVNTETGAGRAQRAKPETQVLTALLRASAFPGELCR